MVKRIIHLKTVERVKDFVKVVSKIECPTDLCSHDNHYIVDAKSIMGIFSLDISKPLTLIINDDEVNAGKYDSMLEKFLKDIEKI